MGKDAGRVRIKVSVRAETYTALQTASREGGVGEAAAIRAAIERGMERYWPRWFDELAASYEALKKGHEECQRHNKLLRGLVGQNEELERIIGIAGETPQ